jgi:hypothetical protein
MSDNWDALSTATRKAWTQIKSTESKMWAHWMVVGEGLYEGRRWAMQQAGTDKPEGKGYTLAYSEWLKRCRIEDMDSSDRAKLLQIMEERPALEEWRAGLPTNVRRSLNNPTTVWRRWKKDTQVKKPKKPGQGDARARAKVEEQQARIEELEEELQDKVVIDLDETPLTVALKIRQAFPETAGEIAKLILNPPKPKRASEQEGARP